MYRFIDAPVVRAAAETSATGILSPPDLASGTGEQLAEWRLWLRKVWASEGFASAVEVASPVLAHRVKEVCDGQRRDEREVRRAVLSVLRYLLRSTSRATPFGLFAGIAPARLGSRSAARFGTKHQPMARVDSGWLTSVIARLESNPDLRRRLLIVSNNLAFVRDDRLVVGCQEQNGSANGAGPAEVSLRYSTAVRTIMRAAGAPILLSDLADKLATDFPATPADVIDKTLAELVAQRILVTNLRPPMTTTDPLAQVVETLSVTGASDLPEVARLVSDLRQVNAYLAEHDRETSPARRRDLRSCASRSMTAISHVDRPVTVDLRLDCDVALPFGVAHEAEAAAAALVKLTPQPAGFLAWQDYHDRFLERYGVGALVPLMDLVNPDAGLGYPAGYRDSRLKPPAMPGLTERDSALLALVQKATVDQNAEIVLTDQTIRELAVTDGVTLRAQPHTELSFRVQAPTLDALNRGDFELALTGVSRAAGTTTGRFLDLLDDHECKRAFDAYAELPTVSENAVKVQVSCRPLSALAENVARSPSVLPFRLPIAEHHDDDRADTAVRLDDLAVSADAQRLYLISVSRQRPIEPIAFTAVEPTNRAHPLLRFLCEISTARSAACIPFSWGAAHQLPFLPRVRYRRTILSPARWSLAATDLPKPNATWQTWTNHMDAWRRRFQVPATVYLGADDRRIRLDLDEPAHQHLLRTDLNTTGHATLREAPDSSAFGWLSGRAHEIVIPLASNENPVPQRAWPTRTIDRQHGHLPAASDWLYVKIYCPPARHIAILTKHLPTLMSTWNNLLEWWFLPYHDPEPHLRLRLRLRNGEQFGQAALRIGAWASDLRQRGLIGQVQWDTYFPETGRFGDDTAMAAAESVFAADSGAAIVQLAGTVLRGGPHLHALIAASMVDLAISFAGSIDEGMDWLVEHARTPAKPTPARHVHDQAIRLADPHDGWGAVRALPGGEHIANAWQRRRAALAAYRGALTDTGDSVPAILSDLLHLHHVRMAGVSLDTERLCTRLARAAALSWTARNRGES